MSFKCLQYISILDCFITGYNFHGGDIGTVNSARDANNCQVECSRNWECNYWTFEPSTKKCHLKRELIQVKRNSGLQSGPKKCLKKSHFEKEMHEVSCYDNTGVDLRGADLKAFASPSTSMCQFSCQQDPACLYYTLFQGVSILKLIHNWYEICS